MIAQVIVDIPAAQVNRPFDYLIPEALEDVVEIGMRVEVPFGSRQLLGFIVSISKSTDFEGKLKPITQLLDYQPFLTLELIELSEYFAEHLHVFRINFLQAMLPNVLRVKYRTIVNVLDPNSFQEMTDIAAPLEVYEKEQLEEYITPYQIKKMVDQQIVNVEYQMKNQAKAKEITYIISLHSSKKYQQIKDELPNSYKRQHAVIDRLIEMVNHGENHQPLKAFAEEATVTTTALKKLEEKGWFELQTKEVYRNPLSHLSLTPTKPKKLLAEQQHAFDYIKERMNRSETQTILLEGVTGSGKTEVYLQLMAEARDNGQSALLLIPEIALTPQMVRQVKGRFQSEIAVLHSGLSDTERYDEWRRIINGEVSIVVGARSSIFAPLKNIGLIIIDEEHETTYKQSDNPRYHARDIALWRTNYHQATLVLGSATPSLESRARAEVGKYGHVMMHERTNQSELPPVKIIDMTKQIAQTTTNELSTELQTAIQNRLDRKEQVILLLNRRGYANFILCRECGHVLQCPHCDISLTYHKIDQQMKCHYCNHQSAVPHVCPMCQSPHLRQQGLGTQKLMETLQDLYPEASIIRMDNDTTRRKGQHEALLKQFADYQADILIGTQMIAKGLDFERVTLVGVINADTGLALPDFRASEKTFQLLTQVSGRAGRGELPGEVLIQTYNPEHYAIQLAQHHDYETFFYYEMKRRHLANYPPYFYTVLITINSKNKSHAYQRAYELKTLFTPYENNQDVIVLGPNQGGIAKINDRYYFQLLIKYKKLETIQSALDQMQIEAQEDAKKHLYVSIDHEPQFFI